MIGSMPTKPLPRGAIVRPIGSTSDLSLGYVEAGEPIRFEGRLYQRVRYPRLGGRVVWSPVVQLERVERADGSRRTRP